MYCTKCGKEIPDGEDKLCEDCKKNVVEENVIKEEKVEGFTAEEKTEVNEETKKVDSDDQNSVTVMESSKKEKDKSWKVSKNKKNIKCGKIIIFLVLLLIVIGALLIYCIMNKNDVGNTIGNIRNYGYSAEQGNWIYYLSPNEDSSKVGIFKIKKNGEDKQQVFMEDIDIVSINVYKNHIYFLGMGTEIYSEEDEIDNKIYRVKLDGSDLEILNDNEVNNDCYEIYVVDNSVYYIGIEAEICKMDLDGNNKEVIANKNTGYLGITDDYIIYNYLENEESTDYVTYIMDRKGGNERAILEGKRLYSVNIEGDYIYYTDDAKNLYRTKIDSGVAEELYDNIEMYNLNVQNGYAYYLSYVNNQADKIGVYRVRLNEKSKVNVTMGEREETDETENKEAPELIKQLDTYSSYIDIVGDWVSYMDSNETEGFINLVNINANENGEREEIKLYSLNYEEYYQKMIAEDYSDVPVDATDGTSQTTENEVEVTNTIENSTVNTVENKTTNTVENKATNAVTENTNKVQ